MENRIGMFFWQQRKRLSEHRLIAFIAGHLDHIDHFHSAGFPARDDKLFETYAYRPLLAFLKEQKAEAPVGLGFFPDSMKSRSGFGCAWVLY